jgi:hypothetical protein
MVTTVIRDSGIALASFLIALKDRSVAKTILEKVVVAGVSPALRAVRRLKTIWF